MTAAKNVGAMTMIKKQVIFRMVLSQNCSGCSQMRACKIRFRQVDGIVHRRVYCPDGTVHLVDCPDGDV